MTKRKSLENEGKKPGKNRGKSAQQLCFDTYTGKLDLPDWESGI